MSALMSRAEIQQFGRETGSGLRLERLSDEQLVLRIARFTEPFYILMTEKEKRSNGLPVTRSEMLAFIILNEPF